LSTCLYLRNASARSGLISTNHRSETSSSSKESQKNQALKLARLVVQFWRLFVVANREAVSRDRSMIGQCPYRLAQRQAWNKWRQTILVKRLKERRGVVLYDAIDGICGHFTIVLDGNWHRALSQIPRVNPFGVWTHVTPSVETVLRLYSLSSKNIISSYGIRVLSLISRKWWLLFFA
jgi:hypothetical protein